MKTSGITKFKETEIGPIPEGWDVLPVYDIVDILGGGTPNTLNSDYWNGDIPWLSVTDFNKGLRFVYNTEKKITELGLNESNTQILKKNQIIISARGTVGMIAQLGRDMTFNQSCYGLTGKNGMSNDFLFYLLKNYISDFKQKSHGAVFDTITRETFKGVPVPIPSKPEQESIAEILSSLDDKIELNQKINTNLEKLATTLFKKWFIEIGEGLPDGWEIKPLDDVADFLNGLALQKYPPESEEDFLPVIKIRELNNGITDATDKASTKIPPEYILENGNIIFSWSGSLDVVIWSNGPGALNQHLFKVTSDRYPKWFYYQWTKHFLPSFQKTASDKAVTMGHIKRGHLTESNVLVPDHKTLSKMDELMSPIIETVIDNSVETRRLMDIRDSLLPRLVNGKIRVSTT